jgi:Tfp pilus assembly protein PilZ
MRLKYKQMYELVNSSRMFLSVGGIFLVFYRSKSVGRETLLASYFHCCGGFTHRLIWKT